MPSLLTSRSDGSGSNGSASGRTLSRVTSFKREWNDDAPEASSSQMEWSPSPERVKVKVPTTLDIAKEARRKAIMAALNPNTVSAPLPAPSASTSTSTSASTLVGSSKPKSRALIEYDEDEDDFQIITNPELPSIPKTLPPKKRQLPWEEKLGNTKKATRNGSSSSTNSKRVNSMPSVNIKQKVLLSLEQQKVLQFVVGDGKNVFFTGSAGTGKSVLLREIIVGLRKKYVQNADAIAVTASTGIAACNIGGVTLHSFGGVGLALEDPGILVQKLRRNKKAVARWIRTKALIIDEVSMVDGAMFDKFNKLGQLIRKNPNKPFGGIQIIVTGDFFQLPPVTKGNVQPKFSFDAQTWSECIDMQVNLTKVFRQKDETFVAMLNEMRFGKLSPSSIAKFRALARPITYDDGIEPTVLFPRREDVDRANTAKLLALNGDGWTYGATDSGSVEPVQRAKLLSNFMAASTLELRLDAQVMLIKNMDETLVNGSMGKVIGFEHKVLFEQDSAGRWIRDVESTLGDEEEDQAKLQFRREQRMKYQAGHSDNVRPNPVVRFNTPVGKRDVCVEPDTFKVELPNGEVQASRLQLPLILSWAMSIHKSQGQTLDRVKVDLGKVFEKGQAYVALSRATSMEGLQVLNFSPDKVQAHKRVTIWSQDLQNLNDLD